MLIHLRSTPVRNLVCVHCTCIVVLICVSRRFYYDCLMKPNAKSVTTALRKVKDLPYSVIANGHGPILK